MASIFVDDLISKAKNWTIDPRKSGQKILGAYEGESLESINLKAEFKLYDKAGIDLDQAEFVGNIESIEELLSLVPDFREILKTNKSIALILSSAQ